MYKDRLIEAQKEAEQILNYCNDKYKLDPLKLYNLKIKVKRILGGRLMYNTMFISIPLWAYDEGLSYFYYYVLHEISHVIVFNAKGFEHGHSDFFKTTEKNLLKDFDLIPEYKKAYIKTLLNSAGQILYKEVKHD